MKELRPNQYFFLNNGRAVKDLFELSKSMSSMPDNVFRHHVNESRNDFANWIRDVVGDNDLAEKVGASKDRKEIQKILSEIIQKDVLKSMGKKKAAKKTTTRRKAANRPAKPKKKFNIGDLMHNLFGKREDIKPENIERRLNCPYKRWECGILEFLFGVMIGLLIAFVLNSLI